MEGTGVEKKRQQCLNVRPKRGTVSVVKDNRSRLSSPLCTVHMDTRDHDEHVLNSSLIRYAGSGPRLNELSVSLFSPFLLLIRGLRADVQPPDSLLPAFVFVLLRLSISASCGQPPSRSLINLSPLAKGLTLQ